MNKLSTFTISVTRKANYLTSILNRIHFDKHTMRIHIEYCYLFTDTQELQRTKGLTFH